MQTINLYALLYLIIYLESINMETPSVRIYLSTKVTNSSNGENKNKNKYTKKNPPTVTNISCHRRFLDIME